LSAGKGASRRRAGLVKHAKGTVVEKDAFLKGYANAREYLSRRLGRLAKDPSEEAIHGARTAIRRLEARVEVLPKSLRNGSGMKETLESWRRVMERSAKVRDLDVTRDKASRHKGPANVQLLAKMDKKRRKLVKDAEKAVESARRLPPPMLSSKRVTRGGMQRRFEKVAGRLWRGVDELLPIVTADPAKLEELHKLRVDSKKLRYLLELTSEKRSPDSLRLKEWQDALGEIHDLDVATAFLRKAGVPGTGGLLREWIMERDREFDGFVRSVLGPA
jgi:CHAD domain-containing protein